MSRAPWILALFLVCGPARADELRISAGGAYEQATLANDDAAESNSIYRGLGLQADARLSFDLGAGGLESGGGLALDLFVQYSKSLTTKNVGAGLDETYRRSGIGGGADFRFGTPFVGLQYISNTITIASGSSSAELVLPTYGFRAGVTFGRSSNLSISLGALYEVGVALPRHSTGIENTQPVNALSGFVLFHFRVLNSSFLSGI
jgi:hypothetical protein